MAGADPSLDRRGRRSGPHGAVDGRSADGRLLRRVREELTAHLGAKPSAVQLGLVERAAWLSLHLSRMDAAMAEGGLASEHASRHYLAWSNSLSKTLRHLGLKGVPD